MTFHIVFIVSYHSKLTVNWWEFGPPQVVFIMNNSIVYVLTTLFGPFSKSTLTFIEVIVIFTFILTILESCTSLRKN